MSNYNLPVAKEEQNSISTNSTDIREELGKVSVILVNFNAGEYLQKCIKSVQNQDYQDYEVILIDNGSSDGSIDRIEADFPSVKIKKIGVNIGFSRANNLGAIDASGIYLAFLNPDTVVEPDWLNKLVIALESNSQIGLVTPKILLQSSPGKINTCGNDVHFTGLPSIRGWMMPEKTLNQTNEVFSVSGAAFVIRRLNFEELGGFDQNFFLYSEDNDLSWRAQLIGYKNLFVPDSIIYHNYDASFSPEKLFYLERNRYQMLLKNYTWKTLLLIFPAILLSSFIVIGYAFMRGNEHLRAIFRSYGWLVGNWQEIIKSRYIVQNQRQVPDKTILRKCSYRLSYNLAHQGLISKLASLVFDPLFYIYYRIFLGFMWW